MSETDWTNVKIPAKLAEAVDEILPRMTFTNRNRFCEDAVRDALRRFREDNEEVQP